MPEYMPIEAHCQGNRGINAVSRLKLNKKILKYSYCKENEKFAHEYLTQTIKIHEIDIDTLVC